MCDDNYSSALGSDTASNITEEQREEKNPDGQTKPLILTHQQTVEEEVNWQEDKGVSDEDKGVSDEYKAVLVELKAVLQEEKAVPEEGTAAATEEEEEAVTVGDKDPSVTDEEVNQIACEIAKQVEAAGQQHSAEMGRHQLARNLSSIPEEEAEENDVEPSSSPSNRPSFFARVMTKFSAASALKGTTSKVAPSDEKTDQLDKEDGE